MAEATTKQASTSTCDVCGKEPAVGVAAVPGVPISMAYGRDCLEANAHPYGILVANTALVGGLDRAGDWWIEMVDATLLHLHKTRVDFDRDVRQVMRDMDEDPHPE